jgi:hypothetical protein
VVDGDAGAVGGVLSLLEESSAMVVVVGGGVAWPTM